MQKITPFLWFDDNAEEAVNFYTSIFRDSEIGKVARYDEAGAGATGRPKGSVMTVSFKLMDQEFAAINSGPIFKFNPSISFFVVLESEKEVDRLWENLKVGGMVLMELQKYDWSEKYGWVQDRFGLSWQVSIGNKEEVGQSITPSLLFAGPQHGRAEEAVNFYTSIFKDSDVTGILKYEAGEEQPEGTVKHAQFSLNGEMFMAMESLGHNFTFNEAISFVVNCDNQEEVDYYWDNLTADGGEESMCGWLKDKFGVSWQITPRKLIQLITSSDPQEAKNAMQAMLKMKKIIIADLAKA
jgi:predicted 3-demethylubiquinone-9 3-methyltransferase (glyoxalase superfamily)